MEMDKYQHQAHKTDETRKSTVSLYGLAGEVGSVFSLYKKQVRDRLPAKNFREQLSEELGDMLWYISSLASVHEIKLSDIAKKNLRKSKSLFDEGSISTFDEGFPRNQRLPRTLRVEFRLNDITKRSEMYIDGKPLGDALSDNSYEQDFYRFHDIFHLSFMTYLGWSPVMRRLLKRKRKKDPKIDENEDGARAAIIEEAIAAVIFNSAEDNDFFRQIQAVPFGLLKTVASLASKFEVKSCTLKQWQQAIWHGCQIYRELVSNGGGFVELDLDERRIDYLGPPKGIAS